MVVKRIGRRLSAAGRFESRVILDGSQTHMRLSWMAGSFESRVILDGSQTSVPRRNFVLPV